MAATFVRAPESTENVPASRRVRDVSKKIGYLDPDIAPLTLILQRMNSASCFNTKFEWIEKDLEPGWTAVNNGAGYADNATSVVVDNGAYVSIGDILNVPRTGEKMLVTNISTNTLTVSRGVGSTAAAALVDNDDIQILGNAYQEGDTSGTEKSHAETYPYNYTQITRTPLAVTGSEMASENYTGSDLDRLRAEKGIVHKMYLEKTALFGERNLDTATNGTTGKPRRYTGGWLYYCGSASNIKDASGILTEPELETWTQDVFAHTSGGDSRLLFCSPLVISVLNQLAAGRIQVVPREKVFGLSLTQWITGHGTLTIIKHRLLEAGPTSGYGYSGEAWAIDPSKMRMRYLRGRNTKLREDIQANDMDGVKDEYLTEAGWEVKNPLVHGRLKGVTG
jgi:hypothetical protein